MKHLRYLLIIPALILGACNGTSSSASSTSEEVISSDTSSSTSEITSESSSSSIESIISSITSSSSSTSSSTSEPTPDPVNPQVENSLWGKAAAQACYDTIGDVVPYMECDAFEFKAGVDDYGDPDFWFYLYYETQEIAEEKIVDYAYVAWEKGLYTCEVGLTWLHDDTSYWQQQVLYADKVLNEQTAIEIMGLASLKNYDGKLMGCLGLYCYTYVPNLDKTKFPMNAVSNCLDGYTPVPEIVGEGYEFSFQFSMYNGRKILQILVKNNSKLYEMEEEYFNALLDMKYNIAQWDDSLEDFTDNYYRKGDTYPGFEDSVCYYCYERYNTFCIYLDYDLSNQVLVLEFYSLEDLDEE